MIDCKHMSAAGDAAIPPDAPLEGERLKRFRAVAAAAKAHGALVIGQVNHPGRQIPSKMINESISASAVQLGESTARQRHLRSDSTKAHDSKFPYRADRRHDIPAHPGSHHRRDHPHS